MSKLFNGIKTDASFIKSHTLQPQWYKILKVFVLLGGMLGYYFLFGWVKTIVFFGVFFVLALILHMVYRAKTNVWRESWLDFIVIEVDGEKRYERIGKFYYSAILLNGLIALVVSQVWF